jgi:hypothetical protein
MKRLFVIFSGMILLLGCGKGGSDNNPNLGGSGGNNPPPAPTQATLSVPAQNSACITGTVISSTESSVSFSWDASTNTDSYELDIKNLLNNSVTTQTTSQTQLTVTLLSGTPYSWYVVSKSSKTTTTAQSDTWKFYNAGPNLFTYAPFPADITSPIYGQQITNTSGTVTLKWQGGVVGKDVIAAFDIYFDINSSPGLYKSNITDTTLTVSVKSGTTYFWKVITKNVEGNSSDSGVYQFSVK